MRNYDFTPIEGLTFLNVPTFVKHLRILVKNGSLPPANILFKDNKVYIVVRHEEGKPFERNTNRGTWIGKNASNLKILKSVEVRTAPKLLFFVVLDSEMDWLRDEIRNRVKQQEGFVHGKWN